MTHLPSKGDLLTESELDAAVHAVQLHALTLGQIPIAGVVSRARARGLHEVLGFGHNLLRSGLPGIHGETAALIHTGLLDDWHTVTVTSSLNPCNFCQRTMCLHLGIRRVRILDNSNLAVPPTTYRLAGVSPKRCEHAPTAGTFHAWVNDPAHRHIWNRDIGIYDVPTAPPWDPAGDPRRTKELLSLAAEVAGRAHAAVREIPPVAALVLDAQGEVLSAGHSRIPLDDDPTATASMSAWRHAGARDHWKDKTLLLWGAGPDHIAHAMFSVFNFGRLVVAGAEALPLGLASLRRDLPRLPITLLADRRARPLVSRYLRQTPLALRRRHLGADHGD